MWLKKCIHDRVELIRNTKFKLSRIRVFILQLKLCDTDVTLKYGQVNKSDMNE